MRWLPSGHIAYYEPHYPSEDFRSLTGGLFQYPPGGMKKWPRDAAEPRDSTGPQDSAEPRNDETEDSEAAPKEKPGSPLRKSLVTEMIEATSGKGYGDLSAGTRFEDQ